ncbi:protein translocase subunit SecF [Candidatus Berkelbacteria bacterium]|nr:protein translocase subunit SecF [Candidatus Berkelbacteria bacterium]
MTFLKHRKFWLSLSAIAILASILALSTWRLHIGIDFKGGQLLEARFKESVDIEKVRETLSAPEKEGKIPLTSVAATTANTFLLRSVVTEKTSIDNLRGFLSDKIGEWEEIRFEQVGPTVGTDLTRKAVWGVILASIGIVLYIAWAFRRVPPPTNSWQFGLTAILALLHDLIITAGAFAFLGHFLGYEVDSLFITALLTVMGFSVHDTIIVYDRIRENLLRDPSHPFEEIVHASLIQTITRSLNTSLTLVIVLLALLILGGSTIKPFVSTLLIGVGVGTYSSIFVAAQLLVVWQSRNPSPRSGGEGE